MDQINQRWGTPGETSIKLSFYWSVDPPALHRQANELLAELLLLHTIKPGCSSAREQEKVFVEEVRLSSCGRLAHLKHYDYNG